MDNLNIVLFTNLTLMSDRSINLIRRLAPTLWSIRCRFPSRPQSLAISLRPSTSTTEKKNMETEPVPPATAGTLRAQISQLDALRTRLAALRHAPAQLLRPPAPSQGDLHLSLPDVFSGQAALARHFADIKALADALASAESQAALRAAAERTKAEAGTAGAAGSTTTLWRASRAAKKPV
jgi:hypothetical protein